LRIPSYDVHIDVAYIFVQSTSNNHISNKILMKSH
jgi:hypothetical protein